MRRQSNIFRCLFKIINIYIISGAYESEQLDKSIYIGDEVILLEEEPEDDGNDTNDNEQNTND